MHYIVVSTSRCKYQYWQIRLLIWSIKRTGQEGKLIILLSKDIGHANEDVNFDFGSELEIIELPDWAHQWKEEHDDWWGGIPNKYESFNWIAANYPFKNNDTLLFLDPDMIFIEKVKVRPKINEIIGQKWQGYKSIKGWPEETVAFMYPFALRYSTLDKIKEDFKNYCFQIRKEINAWESDMWALDYAAKNNGIQIKYIERLGVCTVWKSNDSNPPSPIIHYPNVVESEKGKKIFFKQDYTFQPDQEIKINKAKSATDKKLLINIDLERTDFVYHIKWECSDIFKWYNGKGGMLILRPWPGGFNNIRMSLEIGVCLAYLTNRTLVLPSSYQMYLLEGNSSFSDFFDTSNLGIQTISLNTFCRSKKIGTSLDSAKGISKVLDFDCVTKVLNFDKISVPDSFLKGREEIKSQELFGTEENLFLDGNLLGNWYQTIYSSYDAELKKLIAKYIVYNNNILDLAWEFINFFGDQSYYSIHIRRNDFQYKDLFISCEEILKNLNNIVPQYATLYIATDHKEKEFFKPLEENYNVVYYDDLSKELNLNPENVNWIPIIEQLICARSIKFVGMNLSTFSSYIFRLRGYMNDIEDESYYLNGQLYNPQDQCKFIDDRKFVANWAREYKCSWDFYKETIFVSIASYCDKQIFATLESAINECSSIDRVVFGVHLQDTEKTLKRLQSKKYPNVKILFTKKSDAKGVVWARNEIKRELYDGEDFFLLIDAHTRFKKNWDNILVHQYKSIDKENVVITTYPNAFEISDTEKAYLKNKTNSPICISKFLTDHPKENRMRAGNLPALRNYEIADCRWCAAGFTFAPGRWISEVTFPDDINFNGEEDLMTFLSYLKGFNLITPSEACIFHNYNYKNEKTGRRYKEYNRNIKGDDAMNLVNDFIFGFSYKRSLESLESYLKWHFKYVEGHERIYVSIASFMDRDIINTINDCVRKAKYPQNLHFGICWQHNNKIEIDENFLNSLDSSISVKMDVCHYSESQGVGWARRKAMEFYTNERYCLQIDAHTRFANDWDTLLIGNLRNIKKVCEKPIISILPPDYRTSNQCDSLEYVIPEIVHLSDGCLFDYRDMYASFVREDHISLPILYPSFVFSDGSWVREVLPNTSIYYMGEEVDLSIRSFNEGYRFFTPDCAVIMRTNGGYKAPKHYEYHQLDDVKTLNDSSLTYMKKFFQTELTKKSKKEIAYLDYVNYNEEDNSFGKFEYIKYKFRKVPLTLGIITRCKDEFFIKEFCEYYLSQGVDEINIIDDNSNDKSIYDGLIYNPQINIYYQNNIVHTKYVNTLYRQIKDNYVWMAYVDVDEFISTKKNFKRTIREELKRTFEKADCIKVPWVIMCANGQEGNPDSILNSLVTRWDHDKKHTNNTSKHNKFRCRFEKIEVKCIFRTAMYDDIFDHHPLEIVNRQKPVVVDGIKNEVTRMNSYYDELREADVRTGYLVCYHFRTISVEYAKNKIATNTWYKNYKVEDLMSMDYPEILDKTLKTKIALQNKQEIQ